MCNFDLSVGTAGAPNAAKPSKPTKPPRVEKAPVPQGRVVRMHLQSDGADLPVFVTPNADVEVVTMPRGMHFIL